MVKTALVQDKFHLGNIKENLKLIVSRIIEAKNHQADLILFPELALTGKKLLNLAYDSAVKPFTQELKEIKDLSKNIAICLGVPFMDETHNIYNSYALFYDGEIKGFYHKNIIADPLGYEKGLFSTAPIQLLFNVEDFLFGTLLQEDIFLSNHIEEMISEGVHGLICANNFTAGSRMEDLALKACEYYSKLYGIYVFYINRIGTEDGTIYGGHTRAFNPEGEVINSLTDNKRGMLVLEASAEDVFYARKKLNLAGEISKYRRISFEEEF